MIERKTNHNVTDKLLILCGVVFIAQYFSGGWITEAGVYCTGLTFSEPWRLLSSLFLHGGIDHLFFNMLALFMFGKVLEMKLGSFRFTALYLFSGLFGTAGHFFLETGNVCALGASGAIYGILGALVYIAPKLKIYFYGIGLPMIVAGPLYAVIEFFSLNSIDGIGHSAHLFGFLGGLAFALLLKFMDSGNSGEENRSYETGYP